MSVYDRNLISRFWEIVSITPTQTGLFACYTTAPIVNSFVFDPFDFKFSAMLIQHFLYVSKKKIKMDSVDL